MATLISHKPQKWQDRCPRCGYFHKGHSADMVESEAERCEKICRSKGVPLKSWLSDVDPPDIPRTDHRWNP